MKNPFRYFDSSPEVIRLVVMMYVRFQRQDRHLISRDDYKDRRSGALAEWKALAA